MHSQINWSFQNIINYEIDLWKRGNSAAGAIIDSDGVHPSIPSFAAGLVWINSYSSSIIKVLSVNIVGGT